VGLGRSYRVALLDWLACATRGAGEPAAIAARAAGDGLLERIAFAGAAGHVLDFDDTYPPGLAHLSAPTAPAALVLAASLHRSTGDALDAYAVGFEAMGALAAANHPALYDRGWHPTAVCGPLGAAVAAARLLGLDAERERNARALALLGTGGMRAGFGSDGKALVVGAAAAAGVRAARLAEAGARVPLDRVADGPAGLGESFGATYVDPEVDGEPAVAHNWIKAYPCCLQTHGAIAAAEQVRAAAGAAAAPIELIVHPVSRRAAPYEDAATPLQAKFSIPYTAAFTLLHGPPTVDAFAAVEPAARALARERVRVDTDPALAESEVVLRVNGREAVRVTAPLGSPERPMDATQLAMKVHDLTGDRLDGVLDDPGRPAAEVLAAAGL
jgi:2-methylcitrate dehydratase PrpD